MLVTQNRLSADELTAVIDPTDPALAISGAHDRCRPGPRDRKVRIIVSNRHVTVRRVKFIDPINNIRDPGQRLEAVQEPAGMYTWLQT